MEKCDEGSLSSILHDPEENPFQLWRQRRRRRKMMSGGGEGGDRGEDPCAPEALAKFGEKRQVVKETEGHVFRYILLPSPSAYYIFIDSTCTILYSFVRVYTLLS